MAIKNEILEDFFSKSKTNHFPHKIKNLITSKKDEHEKFSHRKFRVFDDPVIEEESFRTPYNKTEDKSGTNRGQTRDRIEDKPRTNRGQTEDSSNMEKPNRGQTGDRIEDKTRDKLRTNRGQTEDKLRTN